MTEIETPELLFVGDKKYKDLSEFYNSPEWPGFAATVQKKIITILKDFKTYPGVAEADFENSEAFSFAPDSGRVYFDSVDLAARAKFKIVPALKITSPGGIQFFTKKFASQYAQKGSNAPMDRLVQLIEFDINWAYEHYGGGTNGADIFRAGFDTRGRLAYLNPEYEPRKLNRLRRQLDTFGAAQELSATERKNLEQLVRNGRRAFLVKIRKLIDPDNFLDQGNYSSESQLER